MKSWKENINLENLPKKKEITIKRMRIKFDGKTSDGEWNCKKQWSG